MILFYILYALVTNLSCRIYRSLSEIGEMTSSTTCNWYFRVYPQETTQYGLLLYCPVRSGADSMYINDYDVYFQAVFADDSQLG